MRKRNKALRESGMIVQLTAMFKKPQATDKQAFELCNYSDNYYGDQICVMRSGVMGTSSS